MNGQWVVRWIIISCCWETMRDRNVVMYPVGTPAIRWSQREMSGSLHINANVLRACKLMGWSAGIVQSMEYPFLSQFLQGVVIPQKAGMVALWYLHVTLENLRAAWEASLFDFAVARPCRTSGKSKSNTKKVWPGNLRRGFLQKRSKKMRFLQDDAIFHHWRGCRFSRPRFGGQALWFTSPFTGNEIFPVAKLMMGQSSLLFSHSMFEHHQPPPNIWCPLLYCSLDLFLFVLLYSCNVLFWCDVLYAALPALRPLHFFRVWLLFTLQYSSQFVLLLSTPLLLIHVCLSLNRCFHVFHVHCTWFFYCFIPVLFVRLLVSSLLFFSLPFLSVPFVCPFSLLLFNCPFLPGLAASVAMLSQQ